MFGMLPRVGKRASQPPRMEMFGKSLECRGPLPVTAAAYFSLILAGSIYILMICSSLCSAINRWPNMAISITCFVWQIYVTIYIYIYHIALLDFHRVYLVEMERDIGWGAWLLWGLMQLASLVQFGPSGPRSMGLLIWDPNFFPWKVLSTCSNYQTMSPYGFRSVPGS